jgi:hypothetical protein
VKWEVDNDDRRYRQSRSGDDYPAVLRQMKRLGATVLLVGEYRGQGATREQFVKMFATASIKVVFVADIEAVN